MNSLDDNLREATEWWQKQARERGSILRHHLERGTSWDALKPWVSALTKLRKSALGIYMRMPFSKPFFIKVEP